MNSSIITEILDILLKKNDKHLIKNIMDFIKIDCNNCDNKFLEEDGIKCDDCGVYSCCCNRRDEIGGDIECNVTWCYCCERVFCERCRDVSQCEHCGNSYCISCLEDDENLLIVCEDCSECICNECGDDTKCFRCVEDTAYEED